MLQKGYTLIELLAVISIISIVVVVSPVTRNIYRTAETIITVRNIMMDLRWARYKAIDENKSIRVRVYKKDNIYKKDKDFKADYIIYNKEDNKVLKEGTYPGYMVLYKNLNEKRITDEYYDRIEFKDDGTALHGTVGLKYGSKLYKIVVSQLGRVRLAK